MSRFLSYTGVSQISCAAGCETVCGVNAILGYARVSTTGQDLDAQLAALSTAGADRQRIFIDTLSGSAKTARPGLAAMLDYARPEERRRLCGGLSGCHRLRHELRWPGRIGRWR